MADSDREEMISQFTDVTGVAVDRAKFFLESANWTLQLALASFFEQDDNIPIDDNVNIESADDTSSGTASASFFTGSDEGPTQKIQNVDKEKAKIKTASGPRIATIHNMAKSSSEDEDEQGQAFYTGTERSGQQILGPPKKNPIKDYVSEVFRSAQESGAELVEQPQSSAAGSSVFVGTGYRLGQTNDDHIALPDQHSRPNRPQNIEPVILKLWRQGFSINDGDLRLYEEPSNKEFLESIMKGEIPQELRPQGGSMVHVDLEDHRHEEFVRTVKKVKPFAGKGHTLGSPAPNVVEKKLPTAASLENDKEKEKQANEQLNVNSEQPTTMIQVRLADSSRISARFNHSHTVADIRNYITTARPQYASLNFVLLTTFPSKELSNGTETIEQAGLLNAAILQRLK